MHGIVTRFSILVALSLVSIGALGCSTVGVTSGREVGAAAGAVVCVETNAAIAGAEILGEGGNAVDAAVATAFALAVTWPSAGNIGGGGFMLVRLSDGSSDFIDYREVAPQGASPWMFLKEDGNVDDEAIDHSYRGVGIPGTVAGLALAHEKYGKLPWSDLLAPAIRLARFGFVVSKSLEDSIREVAPILAKNAAAASLFLHSDGSPLREGEKLLQPDLARTLARIAKDGAKAFYRGEIAQQIVADSRARGGILTLDDFQNYRAIRREPLKAKHHGCDILAAPPPSSGGQVLIESLNQLDASGFESVAFGSAEELHLLSSATQRAFIDRNVLLADPAFANVPIERLIGKARGDELASSIVRDRATPSDELVARFGAPLAATLPPEAEHTTHFSIVDASGNAVSNTYTLEQSWGSKIVAEGTGIVLNDEMGDFNPKPGSSTRKGRIGTEPNTIRPGQRMLSSMCPVIVTKDGALLLVAGTPGGRTIPSTVLRVLTAIVDRGASPRAALEAARVHHALYPDVTRIEERAGEPVLTQLRTMHHTLEAVPRIGDCHVIARENGELFAFADDRLSGCAAAPR